VMGKREKGLAQEIGKRSISALGGRGAHRALREGVDQKPDREKRGFSKEVSRK